jgi:alpha-1,2-mannosyltransferase
MVTFLIVIAGVLYRPMRARLVAGGAILVVTPFLLQAPGYVMGQWVGWTRMLASAGKLGLEGLWANLFGLLGTVGLVTPPSVQAWIGLAAALATLALCAVTSRRHTPAQAVVLVLALHGCYLMLFSPRTEVNTYSALAPAIAVLCAQAWLVERRRCGPVDLRALRGVLPRLQSSVADMRRRGAGGPADRGDGGRVTSPA